MAETLTIKRVSYGKKDTPLDKREYRAFIQGQWSPVGTIADWKDFARKQDIDELLIMDKDFTRITSIY